MSALFTPALYAESLASSTMTSVNRWDEKAGLQTGCCTLPSYRRARSTEIKETGLLIPSVLNNHARELAFRTARNQTDNTLVSIATLSQFDVMRID